MLDKLSESEVAKGSMLGWGCGWVLNGTKGLL